MTAEARFQEAVSHQAAGRLDEARRLYEALAVEGVLSPAGLNNLGIIDFTQGRRWLAVERFKLALQKVPDYADAARNLALASHQLGREFAAAGQFQAAVEAYQQTLAIHPDHTDALFDLAVLCHGHGDLASALPLYQRCVAVAPRHTNAWSNMGVLYEAQGDMETAEAAYRQAWELDGTEATAGYNLGRLLLNQGRGAEALVLLTVVTTLAPTDLDVRLALMEAHAASQDLAASEALGLEMAAEGGDTARVWLTLGNLRQAADRLDAATDAYRAAIATKPDYVEAWRNLGSVQMAAGDLASAEASFQRAQTLHFDAGIAFREALMLPAMIESTAAITEARKRYKRGLGRLAKQRLTLRDPLAEVGSTSFYLAYHGVNDRPLQEETAKVYLQACPELGWVAPHVTQERRPGGRIRVGFASTFLRRHTIGKLYGGFIDKLDRERFHVTVFQTDRGEPLAAQIAGAADEAVLLSGSLADMRGQIAASALDVLIYPDIGMEPTTYFLAFARLAPVQAVLWGHPMTTGIPHMDYFLSAEAMEPAGAETHYSETLVRLPSLNTYFRRPELPVVLKERSDFGLAGEGAVYLCPQSLFKFHPDFDRACVALLRQDPKGRLVLIEDSSARWQAELVRRLQTLDATVMDRVVFVPRMSEDDFLSLLRCADVLIDPFHFGGGNTSLEAFAMGTPVVTWPSDYLRGRITYALYRQMGIEDLIASDHEQFVALACAVANDPGRRMALSRRIEAAWPTIFERDAAVTELADFLTAAVAASQAGRRLRF